MRTDCRAGKTADRTTRDSFTASLEMGISRREDSTRGIPEEALVREIREELNIEIRVEERLAPVTHAYGEKVIRLIPFLCRWTSGNLQLTEHHAVRWVSPDGIAGYDMLDGDHKIVGEEDNLERITKYAGQG